MKKILLTLACLGAIFTSIAQLNLTYVGDINYDQNLSDIWGYVHPDGTEYAIVGVFNGVSIVSLADPSTPTEVAFVNGVNSTWRDIKTWGDYAYVTNESGDGVAVIDLSDLPNSVQSFNWMPTVQGSGTLETCHNIWIDEFGYAYLVGCNVNGGGMVYVDCFSDPGNPSIAGLGWATYSHDVYVAGNKAYCSEIYTGEFAIYDVSDKENTQFLGNQSTQAQFTHNTWLSDDGTILYTTDEVGGATVGAYDVSDPSNIIELDQFLPYETLGDGVIPHNVHVWEDWLIISYYTDGCILVDGSNPTNLVEVGNFDTYIPDNVGFSGAWGAYPYLPSGLVLVSDIGNGMYVLEPNYVNACWLEGNITDAVTTLPISGATIDILATNVFDESTVSGGYATGYAVPGNYEVSYSKPGYESQTIEVMLDNGVLTIQDVALQPLASFTLNGVVVDAETGYPIPDALVNITNEDFEYETSADASGYFTIPTFFAGSYGIVGGKWGYINTCMDLDLNETTGEVTLELDMGYYDDFSLDFGWIEQGSAPTGAWEIGVPVGTMYFNQPSNPGADVEGDCLDKAYVTGNGGGQVGNDDVDDGQTALISPEFPASGNPTVTFKRWFANYDDTIADDVLEISVSNDTETVIMKEVTSEDEMGVWVDEEFLLSDYLASTTSYRIQLKTADNIFNGSIVEAALDLFQVTYETMPDNIEELTVSMEIYPNPSNGQLNVSAHGPLQNGQLLIYNTLGEVIFMSRIQTGMNRFEIDAAPGAYVIAAQDAQGTILTRETWIVE